MQTAVAWAQLLEAFLAGVAPQLEQENAAGAVWL
jgi:hypothetical protein